MQHLLKKYSHGRLRLSLQNKPYAFAVSCGYHEGKILFHSAKQGKKLAKGVPR